MLRASVLFSRERHWLVLVLRLRPLVERWVPSLALIVAFADIVCSTVPLLHNGDDFIRYYLGGALLLHPDIGASITDMAAQLPRRDAARLLMAASNWSPMLLVSTIVSELLRQNSGASIQPVAWILGFFSVSWLLLLALLLPLAWATLRPVSFVWLLAALLATHLLYSRATPLGPEPRSIGIFATGIALAAWGLGAPLRGVVPWLLLGMAAHPQHQVLNLAVGLPFALLLRLDVIRWTRLALVTVGSLMLCIGLMRLLPAASPVEQTYGLVLTLDLGFNLAVNRPADTLQRIALPVVLVIELLYGHRRALLGAALALLSLGVPALFVHSIYYPGDPIVRIGSAWDAALLALLLQQPRLLPYLTRFSPRLPAAALLFVAALTVAWLNPDHPSAPRAFQEYQATGAHRWGPVEQAILDRLHLPLPPSHAVAGI